MKIKSHHCKTNWFKGGQSLTIKSRNNNLLEVNEMDKEIKGILLDEKNPSRY